MGGPFLFKILFFLLFWYNSVMKNIMNKPVILLLLCFFVLTIFLHNSKIVEAAGPAGIPPWPSIFSGDVTVDGVTVEDGLKVVGVIDDYISNPSYTKNGRISGLTVGPPDSSYFGKDIKFLLDDVVYADQVTRFLNVAVPVNTPFNLSFPAIPLPTATPTPTVPPLPTATPTPQVVYIQPSATPTPIPIGPSDIGPLIFSGNVIVSGGANVEGFEISASLADFPTTYPSVIDSDLKYHNLVIDTSEDDRLYDGAEITFYLNGPGIDPVNSLKSNVSATYSQTTDVITILDLVFIPSSPLLIPEPAKEEEVFLKFTPTPAPTNIPAQANPTATVVTLPTAEVVEDEQNESSAACNKPVGNVSLFTGMGNIMTMVGPLIFFIAYRRVRKFWD